MRTSFLCLLTASLISGCGEFSYKQGAGLHELDNAKQVCRSAEEASAEKCLEAHGWFIHKFDDPNASINDEINKAEPANIEDIKTTAADQNSQPPTKPASSISHSEPLKLYKANPSQIYKISSWWKIGATDKTMKMDLEQCGASLGKEHQPNIAEQLYTKALIHCMNEQGWKALGATK